MTGLNPGARRVGMAGLGLIALVAALSATQAIGDGQRDTRSPALVESGGVRVPMPPPSATPEVTGSVRPAVAPVSGYDVWAAATSAATGVPSRALAAYASATARLDRSSPGCHLNWATLAAVGHVESGNGLAGGGLLPSGRSLEPIRGVPLTGAGPVALVADTDDGRMDGDADHDRAVGPLQFLPSTWSTWGSDADGDGMRNPDDIDDAALSAGRYLCAAGDLSLPEDWTAAVLSYNHSTEYLGAVYAAAESIASAAG